MRTIMVTFFLLILLLGLSACSTCDYEETHAFMKFNSMEEVCYNLRNDERVNGHYCLRRLSEHN